MTRMLVREPRGLSLLAAGAANAAQDTNPVVEGLQCIGNVATSCAVIRSQSAACAGYKGNRCT